MPDTQEWVLLQQVPGIVVVQYNHRYLLTERTWEEDGWPFLGEGLRFSGTTDMYHSMRIHPEDVVVFGQRIAEFNVWRGDLLKITNQLLKLQGHQNDGRGVECVRDIVLLLRQNKISDAKALCFSQADKLDRYPEIRILIKRLFWSWESHPWSLRESLAG